MQTNEQAGVAVRDTIPAGCSGEFLTFTLGALFLRRSRNLRHDVRHPLHGAHDFLQAAGCAN